MTGRQPIIVSRFGNQSDTVRVKNLLLVVPVGDGAQWPSSSSAPVRQPIKVSLTIPYDLRRAAARDDILSSINYGSLSKTVTTSLDAYATTGFSSLERLLDHIFDTCFQAFEAITQMTVHIVKPRALPYAKTVSITSTRVRDGSRVGTVDVLSLEQLSCNLVVGLNACEREDKQVVDFDVDIATESVEKGEVFNWRTLSKKIRTEVENSAFISVESLASLVTESVLRHTGRESDIVTVRAMKPKALVFAEAAEVEIVRTMRDYQTKRNPLGSAAITSFVDFEVAQTPLGLANMVRRMTSNLPPHGQELHTAAIALGSNLGDRFANIERALQILDVDDDTILLREDHGAPKGSTIVSVVNTSFMYETPPMYVTDQPEFINCACIIETNLPPHDLLHLLKTIENIVGRVPTIRNGPRAIDLDIMTYDDIVYDSRPESERGSLDNMQGHLVIPHPRMAEREFVLRPLNDMTPENIHPVHRKSIRQLLSDLMSTQSNDIPAMNKVMAFPIHSQTSTGSASLRNVPATSTYWTFPSHDSQTQHSAVHKTRIMATLNMTPDSFSDGSIHNTLPNALAYVKSSVNAGAAMIDIGGCSTRPGAAYVSAEDEIARIVPIIEAIRASPEPEISRVLISVDTFRQDVARSAVLAGANCINDVYAFTGPAYPFNEDAVRHFIEMRRISRELAVPVVLMHSRGDAGTNKDYSKYENPDFVGTRDDAVLKGVALELGEKVNAIVCGRGGVRRWLVMVDPGVGFSKSVEDNLAVLRQASVITGEVLPGGMANPLCGFPQLIGTSRKSFLAAVLASKDEEGTYTGREVPPMERGWATAAAVACAVQQGAAVVRVHQVWELGDVVRISDALWSQKQRPKTK